MTKANPITTRPAQPGSLTKRMLLGAGIALVLITALLLGVTDPNPEWGTLWMLRPLIIVPLAGATGGAFYHYIDRLRYEAGWKTWATIPLGCLIYIVGLWLGTVLGLAGTLWN